jgi:AcrR family transcriptional regulator
VDDDPVDEQAGDPDAVDAADPTSEAAVASTDGRPAADDLRAADGRRPGRRGMATRQRLLDCTATMLSAAAYRELKVVDIAREAGTSPATFYQYFADVESAVVALAEEMAAKGRGFADTVRAATWRGRKGYAAAEALADEVIAFWEDHGAVMRVVDLATDEGDARFANVRTRLLNDLNNALADAIAEARSAGRVPPDVEPQATAGVLVSMLVHVAAHRYGFEFWGVRTADLRTSMARILFWTISGQKPPGS